LLIRSDEPIPVGLASDQAEYPDTTHLRSRRNGTDPLPILPGTSLAGALRARALRILNTLTGLQGKKQRVVQMIDGIFGNDMDQRPDKHYASRLIVEESELTAQPDDWLVQQRVSIDRFTGGAYDTALFSEAPLTHGEVEIRLTLQGKPTEWDYCAEVGLLLLLLKDLWTSDLPLGGTSSIGRGRLRGISATLCDSLAHEQTSWSLVQQGDSIQVVTLEGTPRSLEDYVKTLHEVLGLA
jgi:CRISPR/Cas system CSM-associated protein Csm3 (group 7 of RAMP superfamily)